MRNGRRYLAILALGWVVGAACAESTRPPEDEPSVAVSARLAAPIARGVRVDLRDQVHHARGLVRKPDGTYRTACVDAPDSLQPAPRHPRDDGGPRR